MPSELGPYTIVLEASAGGVVNTDTSFEITIANVCADVASHTITAVTVNATEQYDYVIRDDPINTLVIEEFEFETAHPLCPKTCVLE